MAARILLVDDDPGVLRALERALKLAGHTVYATSEPLEAINRVEQQAFDIVILDFIMPSMTGVQLLERVRKHLPMIRSIIVSGKLDETLDEDTALTVLRESVEADRFFHKPISNEELLGAVVSLLGSQEEASWQELAGRSFKSVRTTEADVLKAENDLAAHRKDHEQE